jgi:hypothetical protein
MSDDKEIFKIVLLGEGRVGLFLKNNIQEKHL